MTNLERFLPCLVFSKLVFKISSIKIKNKNKKNCNWMLLGKKSDSAQWARIVAAKTVISNGLSNLPSLHKDQGGLKADLMTTMKEVPRLHDLESVKD
jgi:hypothetical protein